MPYVDPKDRFYDFACDECGRRGLELVRMNNGEGCNAMFCRDCLKAALALTEEPTS